MANIFADDAKKASKIYGMFLLHYGKLSSYADQSHPFKVTASWPSGEAIFNAWYTKQMILPEPEGNIEGNVVVVECCLIRKVSRAQFLLNQFRAIGLTSKLGKC